MQSAAGVFQYGFIDVRVVVMTLVLSSISLAGDDCSPFWDTHIGHPGTGGWVYDIKVFDDGLGGGPQIHAGGRFSTAQGGVANYVAKWNAVEGFWMPVGEGMGGAGQGKGVFAQVVFDDGEGAKLYAGGRFTTADGEPANNVAVWDGIAWTPLGAGIEGTGGFIPTVQTLIVHDDGSGSGDRIFVGGRFDIAGGEPVSNVAVWNGESWARAGAGINGQVNVLLEFDDGSGSVLIAGGSFSDAGGVPAENIAQWDGTSWSAFGPGMNGEVNALYVFDDGSGDGPTLYAGGRFTMAGGVPAQRVAKWNVAAGEWSPLGEGVDGSDFDLPGVLGFTAYDDGSGLKLYVSGHFTFAGGNVANSIAAWDSVTQTWSSMGTGIVAWGVTSSVSALTVFDDGLSESPALFVGGYYNTVNDLPSYYSVTWRGCAPPNVEPGDLDEDGVIGFADLLALLALWGDCADPCEADLDDSGDVGFADLLILLANWS